MTPAIALAPAPAGYTSSSLRRAAERYSGDTPVLILDVDTVRARYQAIYAAFPFARLYYAVKANPEASILRALTELGASFDCASPAEIQGCLDAGAHPSTISYTTTIKRSRDIASAYAMGVRLYAADTAAEIDKLAEHAPGSSLWVRIAVDNAGAATPFGQKFGCEPNRATALLRRAQLRGLTPYGISCHVGSQQSDPSAWDRAISRAAGIYRDLAAEGIELATINLGGGLPATYTGPVPPLSHYAAEIDDSLHRHFGNHRPAVILEPGRAMVASAGVIVTEVVQVSHRFGRRWIYLDIGRYGGLAETEGEAIIYPLLAQREDLSVGPAIVAGPTADGDDVLYQRHQPELPLSLVAGDRIVIHVTGAYTATYAAIAFNGIAPLRVTLTDTEAA